VSGFTPSPASSKEIGNTNSAVKRAVSRLGRPFSIGSGRSLLAALTIVVALECMAWLVFVPLYETNDDVAIRLVLEGRIAPGAAPSGYAFFINLALGQTIAALYCLLPSIHWYDLVEHGTLWLSATLALYCGIRRLRSWPDVAFVALIASVFLTAFINIQFTIVATFSTVVGATALLFVRRMPIRTFETTALTVCGTASIVLGCLFRLEAGLLALFVIAIVGAASALQRSWKWASGPSRLLLIPVAGLVLIAAAWIYHGFLLAWSPAWHEFFAFNLERARLGEYFASRLDRATLAQAYQAAGWSIAEHDLVVNWLLIDPQFFNSENLRTILSHLPGLPPSSGVRMVNLLSSYVVRFPFVACALLGLVLYQATKRAAGSVLFATAALAACIVVISTLLKPLDFRVFWPLACGYLIALWMVAPWDGETRFRRFIAPVVVLSFLSAAAFVLRSDLQTIAYRTDWTRNARADLMQLALPMQKTAVVIGANLPFEAIERPFGPPIVQRDIKVLPLGVLVVSPVMAPLVSRLAGPDLAAWMCSDDAVLITDAQAASVLAAYYPRRRNYDVDMTRIFSGRTFSAYRCRRGPAAG
jgi:hypothetical protein